MKEPQPQRTPLMFLKAALITIGIAITFVYVIGRMGSNVPPPPAEKDAAPATPGEANADCAASSKIAGAIAGLAKGEVAALAVSKTPAKLPDYSFDGPDGQKTSLAAFSGKTVLFNLWATWCAPCRAEMPALDKLQTEFGSDKFQVVAVNIDTNRLDKPKAFLEEAGVKSLTYYSDSKAEVFQELKASGKALGLPATLLIGPDGCQIGALNGPAVWDSADAKAMIADTVGAALR